MVTERTSFGAFIKLHVIKHDCPGYTWGKLLSIEDFMAFMPWNVMMILLRSYHLYLQSKNVYHR